MCVCDRRKECEYDYQCDGCLHNRSADDTGKKRYNKTTIDTKSLDRSDPKKISS